LPPFLEFSPPFHAFSQQKTNAPASLYKYFSRLLHPPCSFFRPGLRPLNFSFSLLPRPLGWRVAPQFFLCLLRSDKQSCGFTGVLFTRNETFPLFAPGASAARFTLHWPPASRQSTAVFFQLIASLLLLLLANKRFLYFPALSFP